MYTRWTQHLKTEEEKEKYRKKVMDAKDILEHLQLMIEEDEKALDRSEQDQKIYDTPNWDYRQAHKNGIRWYIAVMKNLINLDQRK